MMTPIHKIPMGDTTRTLTQLIDDESSTSTRDAHEMLIVLSDHDSKDESLSITLDWAMQLRAETGRSWGECIDTAMILFYG